MSKRAAILLATMLGSGAATAQEKAGDAATGRALTAALGCTACHVIPGLRGLSSHVGPSLAGIGGDRYIAGILPNTPENLVRWLRDPPAVAPGTAMPAQGLDEPTARHIAAFLATLR